MHLLGASHRYVTWNDPKQVAKELRPVYAAVDAQAAEAALDEFEAGIGARYPAVVSLCRSSWEQFIPFLDCPPEARRVICTTNMIESINRQLTKVTKNRGHFPNEQAALKLLCLAMRNITTNTAGPQRTGTIGWKRCLNQLAVRYPGRLPLTQNDQPTGPLTQNIRVSLLGWHRRRIARHWTQPSRTPGRPSTSGSLRRLIVEIATNNPTWGYRRITAELVGLGHRVGASTVWRILKQHRIDPAPQRTSLTWTQFLRSQAAVACDFVTVDTALLRRYYLLLFIDVTNREVFYGGITANPTGAWTTQAARNLFVRHRDRFTHTRALVRDRASQFVNDFDEILRSEGLKILRNPVRFPVANAFAERWIGTLRRDFLDRTIIWNQRQLQRLAIDYIDHYNTHRPHRSLDQRPPRHTNPDDNTTDHPLPLRLVRTTRCDGLINEYKHAA